MAPRQPSLWKASDPSKLLWREWDEDCVVFDSRSGQIHLLNPTAAEALRLLEEGPADAVGLARHLGAALGQEPDDVLTRQVDDLLAQFDGLGLAEPVGG